MLAWPYIIYKILVLHPGIWITFANAQFIALANIIDKLLYSLLYMHHATRACPNYVSWRF